MTNAQKNNCRRRFNADAVVAVRLRKMRNLLDMSQADVANRIGLTIQQLQKYEKAGNRISAGRLHQLAELYGCPVSWFFGELDNAGLNPLSDSELDFLRLLRSCTADGQQIVLQLLNSLRSAAVLKQNNRQSAAEKTLPPAPPMSSAP